MKASDLNKSINSFCLINDFRQYNVLLILNYIFQYQPGKYRVYQICNFSMATLIYVFDFDKSVR